MKLFENVMRFCLPVAAATAVGVVAPKPAEAATLDIFLIASQSMPTNGASTNFDVQTTKVYQLGDLNGRGIADSVTEVSNFTFNISEPLTYNNQEIPRAGGHIHDAGEPGAGTADRFNSQVGAWDSVGPAGDQASEVDQNIDFGRNSYVTFNPSANGFTDLLIAENGGLNPFYVDLCPDAACTSSERIFGGFGPPIINFLLGSDDFAMLDSDVASEMDQSLLFRFSDPVYDYVRIREQDDRNIFTNERLEVDFIGVNSLATLPTVPVPAGLPLLLTGLGVIGWMRRRQTA